jgi:selenocysteine lyase/cysteine desulfurase
VADVMVFNQNSPMLDLEEEEWKAIKNEFLLDKNYIHLSLSVVTPHPRQVREAIEQHRIGFDTNPAKYFKKKDEMQRLVLTKAAKYLNTSLDSIALTESTTMGLAVVYGGMRMDRGEEILTTFHDHYTHSEILRFKARDQKCLIKKIPLYDDPSQASQDLMIENLFKNITPFTRVLALTWVHSSTGVKLPLQEIGERLKLVNQQRRDQEKILLCVDGLHAFGVENIHIEELCCDFFIAGCHKSFFGPRGTGIIWGSELGWSRIKPIITSFDVEVFWPWFEGNISDLVAPKARLCSPGGFPAFEHRWALKEAFDFHLNIGKERIQGRIQELNSYAKEKIKQIPGIQMHTPVSPSISAGMVCFTVEGKDPSEVVEFFEHENIMIGQTPYRRTSNRFAIGVLNTYEEIDYACEILKKCTIF